MRYVGIKSDDIAAVVLFFQKKDTHLRILVDTDRDFLLLIAHLSYATPPHPHNTRDCEYNITRIASPSLSSRPQQRPTDKDQRHKHRTTTINSSDDEKSQRRVLGVGGRQRERIRETHSIPFPIRHRESDSPTHIEEDQLSS